MVVRGEIRGTDFMRELIRFEVDAKPIPQGSMISHRVRNSSRIITRHASASLLPWRKLVGMVARAAMAKAKQKCVNRYHGIRVEFTVFVERGNKTRKYPTARTDGGDIDKLERALLDALTGICFADDSQVFDVSKKMLFAPTAGLRCVVLWDEEE